MSTVEFGAPVAEPKMPSEDGPKVTERGTYRFVTIAIALMMAIGSLFAVVPMAGAQPASARNVAGLQPGSQADVLASIAGTSGSGVLHAQSGPSLVDLLVETLLDLVAVVQADNDAVPPVEENGIVGIIYSAADAYGQPREDMLRVASCESNLDPYAVNASSGASGLFQFMPGTWATTPFADQDIFNAEANANAAAWMWANGRRGEWSCQ